MRIRYTNRIKNKFAFGYEWSRSTGYVQEVADPAHVAALLTEPQVGGFRGEFVIDDRDSFLQWMTADEAVRVAVEGGIVTVRALGELNKKACKALAVTLGVSPALVDEWQTAAREFLSDPVAGAAEEDPPPSTG